MKGLGSILARAIAPPARQIAWQWCEANLVLAPPIPTPAPGPWRSTLTPWVRGWMDAWQDDGVEEVTIMKGGQCAATQTMLNLVCFETVCDPGPTLIVLDSEDNARSASEMRLMPLIDASPAVAAEKPVDLHDYKKLEYKMRRNVIRWVGSNSAGKLASRPVRYLFQDEVEKYKQSVGREGNAVALGEQRTKAFWNRKRWKSSSPTTPMGPIAKSFQEGDQRRFFVPCPSCGKRQYLKWQQVKFDSNLPPMEAAEAAFYECEHCKAKWTNADKDEAVQKGEWKATATPKRKGHASFHIWALYCPWDSCSLETLVAKFLSVKDDPSRLREFINEDLGECWVIQSLSTAEVELTRRVAPYQRGMLFAQATPFAAKYKSLSTILLMSVDVQKFSMWWMMRQWITGGDSGLMDWGQVYSWKDLSDLADKHECPHVLVDAGYGERAQETYEACLMYDFLPCKGASGRLPMLWTQTNINIYEGTRKQSTGESVSLIMHDSVTIKLQLYDRVTGVAPFGWFIPQNTGADYADHMTSEEYVNGKWDLKRGRRNNHAWDLEVLQLLGATIYGYDRKIL